jgi:hypothetical protein
VLFGYIQRGLQSRPVHELCITDEATGSSPSNSGQDTPEVSITETLLTTGKEQARLLRPHPVSKSPG